MTPPPQGRFVPTGKAVVAHPLRVAQADQLAAHEGIETVLLRDLVPTTHVYIIDFDQALALPDEPFFGWKNR